MRMGGRVIVPHFFFQHKESIVVNDLAQRPAGLAS